MSRLLLICVLPLSLSGCLRDFLGGEKNVLSPEIIKVKGRIDTPKEPVKEIQNQPPAAEENKSTGCPPVEERFLPQQLNPLSPECLMPVPPPKPRPLSDPPHSLAAPARRKMAIGTPDFSYHDAMITEDTTWHGVVLIEGGLTVAPQATLTIQAGTVVRFCSASAAAHRGVLAVQGRIVVNGAKDRPVIFTSMFKDPAAGDWQGIVLLGSGKKNLFGHSRVEGAEIGLDASFSTVTLNEVFFRKSCSGARMQDSFAIMTDGGACGCRDGMAFYDCEVNIRTAVFSDNRQGVFASRTSLVLAGARFASNDQQALVADSCRLRIAGNSFIGNGSGLSLVGSEGTVTANRIEKNTVNGLVLAQSRIKVHGNAIEQNGKAGLRVEDGKGIAWGNVLAANGEYDLYNAGSEEFRAIGNWWGGDAVPDVGRRIYDRQMDGARGRVLYFPQLLKRPLLRPETGE